MNPSQFINQIKSNSPRDYEILEILSESDFYTWENILEYMIVTIDYHKEEIGNLRYNEYPDYKDANKIIVSLNTAKEIIKNRTSN